MLSIGDDCFPFRNGIIVCNIKTRPQSSTNSLRGIHVHQKFKYCCVQNSFHQTVLWVAHM